MWSHIPARNLISLQQTAAIAQIDRQITQLWQDGYGLDVDELLEQRHALTQAIKQWNGQ